MSKHNNKLKRTALAGALLVSVSSTPSHAFLLCNDFPALAENMYGHIQDAMAYAQQKEMAGNASEACSAVTASKGYEAAMCASTNEQKVSLAKQAMSTIDRAVTANQFEAVQLRAAKKLEDACFAEPGGEYGTVYLLR
ncbi:hypothetical protein I3271_09340 [Photobacterium leiognathi]|uniref:hypothetical protein n=1 Tax=Photobacterium leiognathi TaxID=553611 RepID=UPI001EDEB19B|nr:hypothetical protein [Photobacterium leiognathi]MCG3884891.1 hypothetical protein [Photobacterium leiognathi]